MDYQVHNPHVTDFSNARNWHTKYPAIALGALALGAGGRLFKNLLDLGRNPDDGAVSLPSGTSPITEVPLEVSPEEAEELRRRGVSVRNKLAQAGDTYREVQGPSSLLGGALLGAGGTALGMGGWYLADKLIDSLRRRAATNDLSRVRQRIQKVIDDEPEEEDQPLYGYMKAAEDTHFNQRLKKEALGYMDLPWLAATALGGGAMFNLLSGYQESKRKSPYEAKARKLKSFLKGRSTTQPKIVLSPFTAGHPTEDAKEKEDAVEEILMDAPQEEPVMAPIPAASPKPATNWF